MYRWRRIKGKLHWSGIRIDKTTNLKGKFERSEKLEENVMVIEEEMFASRRTGKNNIYSGSLEKMLKGNSPASVADPGCLSRIRIFFHPGSDKKKTVRKR
jgi:hypothetical protein